MDFATTADLRFSVLRRRTSSAVARRGFVPLAKWTAILAAADIAGVGLIAVVVFWLYASPLNYDDGQLWVGLASFLFGWIIAAWLQNLYARKTLLSGARVHSQNGLAACALTFGIVLLLGFALKFIGGVSRGWLLT